MDIVCDFPFSQSLKKRDVDLMGTKECLKVCCPQSLAGSLTLKSGRLFERVCRVSRRFESGHSAVFLLSLSGRVFVMLGAVAQRP